MIVDNLVLADSNVRGSKMVKVKAAIEVLIMKVGKNGLEVANHKKVGTNVVTNLFGVELDFENIVAKIYLDFKVY